MPLLRSMQERASGEPPRPRTRTRPALPAVALEPGYLGALVTGQDRLLEESRLVSDVIHVSSLIHFCPRKSILAKKDAPNLGKAPSSMERVMWAIGRAVEFHVRTQFIAAVGMPQVLGRWSCFCQGSKVEGLGVSHRVCNQCRNPVSLYGEWLLEDRELRLVGNPDLLFLRPDGQLQVIEIKSKNKKAFDALHEPEANHLFQSTAYHMLLSRAGLSYPVHPEVVVFYVCKDFAFAGSPYREFHVPASNMANIVEGKFAQVREMRRMEHRSVLPPRLSACATHMSVTAKNCELCVSCFSRKD